MMKHRMMTSLAIAAIAAATLGIPAFAAETKQEDCYTVTVRMPLAADRQDHT